MATNFRVGINIRLITGIDDG